MAWEFRQVMTTSDDFEAILNELGLDGWDLAYVSVLPGTSPIQMIAILKRQRPANQPIPTHDLNRP